MNSETNISKSKVLAKAVFNLAEQLQLKDSELALILGISETELSLTLKEDGLDPNAAEGERALTLVCIYRELFSLNGGDLNWMRRFIDSPNRLLNHQTPRSLMKTEKGLKKVLHLVEWLQ